MFMALIYVAASFFRLKDAARLRAYLRAAGHGVNSRWIDGGAELAATGEYFSADAEMARYAAIDCEDVMAANTLVQITGDKQTHGARHSELGMAMATGKRMVLLGPREQIFHFHSAVRVVKDLAELLAVLA